MSIVSRAVASLKPQYINFVSSQRVIRKFHEIARFPRVLGAIDCTHVRIGITDINHAQLFYCHHGYYSINVQIICDADQRITNTAARWQGSTQG